MFSGFAPLGSPGWAYADADAAVARIASIYDRNVAIVRDAFARFAGETADRLGPIDACYPFLGIQVERQSLNLDAEARSAPCTIRASTAPLTRPALFREYFLARSCACSSTIVVPDGRRDQPARKPFPYVIQEHSDDLAPGWRIADLAATLPDMPH